MKKRCMNLFSFYDVNSMEQYLERMARKGWMLDKIGNFFWEFVPCEPVRVRFGVTYYPQASAFEPEPSEGQQTLEDFCDHAGWKLAASNAKLMIFVSYREDPVPIHTDPLTELECIQKTGKNITGVWAILAVICLLNSVMPWITFASDPIGFLSTPILFVNALVQPLMCLYLLCELFTWNRWKKRARVAAEEGEFLPVRGHQRMLMAVLVLFLFGIAYAFLGSGPDFFSGTILFMLLAIFALIFVVNQVRDALKRRKVSTRKNMAITLTVDAILAIALTVGITASLFHQMGTTERGGGDMILTIQALTGDDGETFQRTDLQHSPLLTYSRGFEYPDFLGEGKKPRTLSYELLDVHFSPIYDLCRDKWLHDYDDRPNEEGELGYRPADPSPWGAEEVYQLYRNGEPKHEYLIGWPDRILLLDADWSLTREQMGRIDELLNRGA